MKHRGSPRARPVTTFARVPLARALSKLRLASRTDANALIRAGRVTVDGVTTRDPTRPVIPERIRVRIDDVEPQRTRAVRVLALNKPRGAVTTRRDPAGRPTVFAVIGPEAAGLIAVGRLDLASTGLLLFTNDTQLAHALTDPRRAVPRTYVVTVRGRVTHEQAQWLVAGVKMPSRPSAQTSERLHAADVQIRKASHRETHLLVTLTEGRNREIRRLFDAIGHEVTRLHRIAYGAATLGNLQPGRTRWLTPAEVDRLSGGR